MICSFQNTVKWITDEISPKKIQVHLGSGPCCLSKKDLKYNLQDLRHRGDQYKLPDLVLNEEPNESFQKPRSDNYYVSSWVKHLGQE